VSAQAVLVGIDLGTTVCKAMVFDQDLRILAGASQPLALATISGTEIEQEAEDWWKASAHVVRRALRESGCDPRQVRGLGISSQGIAFVPVDDSDAPLRPAISWLDTRAAAQRQLVLDAMGEQRIFSLTGKRCSEAYVLPKLLWLREHEPEVWAATRRILMPLDFLLARLTGEHLTDHTMASGTMFYDVTRRQWSPRILSTFDLDPRLLPVIGQGGERAGGLRQPAAGELGLPAGTPVAVGGQDQKVAALGAGIDLDRCTISLGTAMAITQKCDRPVIDAAMRVPCFADLLPGRWVIEGSSVCCSILDWAKQAFFPQAGWDEVNCLADEAAELPNLPTMLPFFSGAPAPFFDPSARGTLTGLDLSTTPAQVVRSIYEGIAFLIRANVEVMESISRPVGGLRIFGGGSKSDPWCRIIADAVQRPVAALATAESASVGAAILAGMAGRVFADPEEAFAHLAVRTSYEPRPGRAARCDEHYARFRSLAGRLLDGREPVRPTWAPGLKARGRRSR
jgi:xylulokinase